MDVLRPKYKGFVLVHSGVVVEWNNCLWLKGVLESGIALVGCAHVKLIVSGDHGFHRSQVMH